jgi:hypothetical protein
MATQTTTTHDPCPSCDQLKNIYWVSSTPDTDTWACHGCSTEWTITVHPSQRDEGRPASALQPASELGRF